ncbi:MAG: phosphotriesterase-related protein [Firmicutes bacterium]|nr:phosphotriesterase-related protein [Bacillota bacterium]
MFVQTINKQVTPNDLGITYIHEHLLSEPPLWLQKQDPDLVLQDLQASAREVEIFLAAGGNTLVDMTAVDYGRNIHAQARIAKMTGVNLVVTTGFNKGLFFPEWVSQSTTDVIAHWMISELTVGIEGTDYKAGLIKVGTGYNTISTDERKVITAAAIAHKETGAPIAAHTEAGTMPLEQLTLMESLGVNLNQVIIAHADRNIDRYVMNEIAARGAYVEFDGPSKIKYYPDQARVDAIIGLVKAGFDKQIVISGDMARQSYLEAYGGGPGFRFLISKFIPRLHHEFAANGLDPAMADRMIRENSHQALTWRQ